MKKCGAIHDTDGDVTRAFGDKSQRRCAVNQNTRSLQQSKCDILPLSVLFANASEQRTSCCVVHVWKETSEVNPDPILSTSCLKTACVSAGLFLADVEQTLHKPAYNWWGFSSRKMWIGCCCCFCTHPVYLQFSTRNKGKSTETPPNRRFSVTLHCFCTRMQFIFNKPIFQLFVSGLFCYAEMGGGGGV